MPPTQQQDPYQQPAPSQHDPSRYEFIMSPDQQPKPSLFGGGLNRRFVALAAGGIIGLVLLLVLIGSLLGGGKSDTTALVSIAAEQAEIVRVTDQSFSHTSSQDTKNFATNTDLCIASSQQELLAYLAKNGVKVNDKQLAAKHNPKTDATLQAANESGTFDSTLITTLQSQLTSYRASLQTAYKTATGKQEKKVLSDAYAQAGLLLKQSEQHS